MSLETPRRSLDHLVGATERPRFRLTGVTEYRIGTAASVCLDVGSPDHLGPLLGFGGDELTEVRGRHRHRLVAEVGKPSLDALIGEGGVDLVVEPLDDVSRRVPWRAESRDPS